LLILVLLDRFLLGRGYYKETASNLAVWSLNLIVAAQAIILITPLYHWAYQHQFYRFVDDSFFTILLAIVVYDFFYYVFHRISHKVSLLWALHSVHHQTHQLIPSLGLRSSTFDFAVIWMITIPLVLIGFGSHYVITALFAHGLYQLFLHNEWKVSLGPFEWLLNTPSHHRLHHATNKEYIDKNFGSILIIWDRLFGTYVARSVEPIIGVHGVNMHHDPLLTNIMPFFGKNAPQQWQGRYHPFMTWAALSLVIIAIGGIFFDYLQNPVLCIGVLVVLVIQSLLGLRLKPKLKS
jgi:sterol desaturase/sphingolipid hydroxylase (fatty acid hydroxylase superfamily)